MAPNIRRVPLLKAKGEHGSELMASRFRGRLAMRGY
jgi:hypothetical protein